PQPRRSNPTGDDRFRSGVGLLQVDGDAVDAVAQPSPVLGAIGEDVSQVGVAPCTTDLGAHHAVRAVLYQRDGVWRDGLGEAGPAAAGVELAVAGVERIAARRAAVQAVV